MAEWQDGGMAEWQDGGMAEGRNDGMCPFSHYLFWLRRILWGMGGGGLKKGGTLCGLQNHRDVNPPQASLQHHLS
jgi:hypothetical protein